MKKIKSFFSVSIAFVMIFCLSTTAFATSDPTVQVLKNNDKACIVKEINSDGVTIATNDKQTNILTVENYDATGKSLKSTNVIDLNDITEETASSKMAMTKSTYGNGDIYQHTFSDREYDIYFGDVVDTWKLRSVTTTIWVPGISSKLSKLESFRSEVEDINEAEYVLIAAVGAGVAATAISAYLSGGLAAGIAAAGGTVAVVAAFAALNKHCNNADYYFNKL